ncbi:XRE family transcriptional regulator [Luteimonas aestuarii]|uniref:XRE family transcriptional regulator n=1 Tax=Luteimonas aestuarii TaxID=453837 RepID=A0A4R5U3V0_9GAMM|nr:helix-turn-helix transcriptional regulator [Luteimonas aestuarii]TDK28381.1 XRE family transcriptional regulator [Luteimonas aestuarii]
MALSIDLVNALKRGLRAQGMTYRELAARIDLSEAAVKRMFSRRAMSLVRLEQICDVLGMGLAELGADAGRGQEPMARLTQAQEQALVDDPALMLAMFLSINRWQQPDVSAHFNFSVPQWTALLARLDRMGIIELQAGNRVRPLTARNFRWLTDGPMERYFRTELLGDYFAAPFDGDHDRLLLLSGSLSPDGVQQMRQRLDEVAREFDGLLARDAALPSEQRVGVSLVLAQKPWLLRLFAPYRRNTA